MWGLTAGRRPTDVVARYGGEEFGIVLSGADAESALRIAEIARAEVEALGIEHSRSNTRRLTISAGLAATTPAPNAEPSSLIDVADKALYRAKHEGRNRVV
jgi:diguanylate cyclase (GGDEF)-like protein